MKNQGVSGVWYKQELEGNRKKLGTGGYGSVYELVNTMNGRKVAVKVTQVIKKEIELMLKIPLHENIVEIPRDGSCR